MVGEHLGQKQQDSSTPSTTLRHRGAILTKMMVHDIETNPGPQSITECLEFLVSTKREFDEDDVRLLGRLLLSFKWCSELTAGFRKRLGMKAKQGGPGRSWKKNLRKFHAGPGRGKKGAKENPINLLQESLSDIEENQLEEILPKIAAKITEDGLCRVLFPLYWSPFDSTTWFLFYF